VGTYLVDTKPQVDACFGCGPGRSQGEGLRIFSGVSARSDIVIAAWRPSEAFADHRDRTILDRRYVWAALDCPGGWARIVLSHPTKEKAVTAFLAADLLRPVAVQEPHIVMGWLIGRDGSKTRVGSAVVGMNGDPCAVAEALWIDLPDEVSPGISMTPKG
jgi:hypothetical protein